MGMKLPQKPRKTGLVADHVQIWGQVIWERAYNCQTLSCALFYDILFLSYILQETSNLMTKRVPWIL